MGEDYKLKHADLLYDYIKFHLGLYIATPPVLVIVASALGVIDKPTFQWSMVGLVVVYFIAGIHASWTVASHINVEWSGETKWKEFGDQASHLRRRVLHHYLYWLGLVIGLLGMIGSFL